jgi:hypothetical protein
VSSAGLEMIQMKVNPKYCPSYLNIKNKNPLNTLLDGCALVSTVNYKLFHFLTHLVTTAHL